MWQAAELAMMSKMSGASNAACWPVSSFEKRSTSASNRARICSTVDFSWSGRGMLRVLSLTAC
jgi:hypothetical protein